MKTLRDQPSTPPTKRISVATPESLHWDMQEVQLAVARRAYELFETRGQEHGHDWEDWFRAESELLRPVSFSMSEAQDETNVLVNVFGFEENELRVSVEPRCVTVLGKKKTSVLETEGGKIEYIDWYPDQLMCAINLDSEVRPEAAVVELHAGVLEFRLPKASPRSATPEESAA